MWKIRAIRWLLMVIMLTGVFASGRLEAGPAGQTHTVQVSGALSPALVRVDIGDAVKFEVADQNRHRLREVGGHFDTGVLGPGETYTFTVSGYPGAYYEYRVVDTFTGSEMRICAAYCNDDFFWIYLPLVAR